MSWHCPFCSNKYPDSSMGVPKLSPKKIACEVCVNRD